MMRSARRHVGRVVAACGIGLLVAGVLTPAEATIGADPCPEGMDLVAKFEVSGDGYVFEKPEGNEGVVTLGDDADLDGGSWTSTVDIGAVVVKGGSGDQSVDVDLYDPAVREGTFDNLELVNPGGNVPDISFVAFCGPSSTTTSSTSTTTTSTTEPTTATTSEPTTTTTAQLTTTSTTTEASVLPTQVTNATPTTTAEVLGVQLVRTGNDTGLMAVGVLLVVLGSAWELAARRVRAGQTS